MLLIKLGDYNSIKIKYRDGFMRMFLEMKNYNLNNFFYMKDFDKDLVFFVI